MGCTEKNPLQREGTSSLTRALPALLPGFVKPDERMPDDLMRFLYRYAAFLNFYDGSNALNGDWQSFMKEDVSVTLASILNLDIANTSNYKKLLYKKIRQGNVGAAKKNFKYLFDILFSLPLLLTENYRLLPIDFDYREELKSVIESKLLQPLVNLKALYDLFVGNNIIDTAAGIDSEAPLPVTSSGNFLLVQLGNEWVLPPVVAGLTVPALSNAQQKIIYIINHNFFASQVDSLLRGISAVTVKAEALFETTLQNFPSHKPHYALVIAFIKLFKIAQDDLNGFTTRHLDFYYKEVLQLGNRKAQPDSVHLIAELQKSIAKHLLSKGTLFKGGKDDISGKELTYALNEETVLNNAVVESLQAIHVDDKAKEKIVSYPIAASEDGNGGKLLSPDKSWHAFGNPSLTPQTAVGFAIVSNILFLNEGTRTITITATFAPGTNRFLESFPAAHPDFFKAELTTDKGWHKAPVQVQPNTSGDVLTFSCTLNAEDPAIVPYSEKIHKQFLETDLPVMRILLNQENAFSYPYKALSLDPIVSLQVSADVQGVKDLVLSNQTGNIDASKPFKPFGEFPAIGATFYIGSKEIFQKKITELTFVYENEINENGQVDYLYRGNWDISQLFTPGTNTLSLVGNVFPPAKVDFSKNEPLTATTREGFVRLTLASEDYSMDTYLGLVKDQINSTTVTKVAGDPITYQINTGDIASPPELILNSFSLNYHASSIISFTGTSSDSLIKMLHLMPFGFSEVKYNPQRPSGRITLVHEMPARGELFVGLSNTSPEEVVSILFQVAEGSSNPLRDVETVKWFYLAAENEWKELEKRFVVDRTGNFTQSGIVTLTLPADISNQNTLLKKGYYWIKAAVEQFPDAVCKMITVQAGALLVKLVQDELNNIFFTHTLPAGTISKLLVADGAVKTIEQPYDSVGGRQVERDEHFYVRVSERLRHKQRGIAIWDYEHIILEQFPEIKKVRCINHAGFYADAALNDVFCENYPGHVTIITIPDFLNKSGIDPGKPFTPVGILNRIDAYMRTIISPFVKLHVKVPQFEEVQLEFKVSFHENLDDAFYRQLLNKDIEKYLTPWAVESGGEISFGSRIIKSVVLNFVEERPYVDYVTDFKMHHIIRRNGATHLEEKRNIDEAIPSTARSLIVSYSNEITLQAHLISSPATCEC